MQKDALKARLFTASTLAPHCIEILSRANIGIRKVIHGHPERRISVNANTIQGIFQKLHCQPLAILYHRKNSLGIGLSTNESPADLAGNANFELGLLEDTLASPC